MHKSVTITITAQSSYYGRKKKNQWSIGERTSEYNSGVYPGTECDYLYSVGGGGGGSHTQKFH